MSSMNYGIAFRAMGTMDYWLTIVLTLVMLLLPVVGVRYFWQAN